MEKSPEGSMEGIIDSKKENFFEKYAKPLNSKEFRELTRDQYEKYFNEYIEELDDVSKALTEEDKMALKCLNQYQKSLEEFSHMANQKEKRNFFRDMKSNFLDHDEDAKKIEEDQLTDEEKEFLEYIFDEINKRKSPEENKMYDQLKDDLAKILQKISYNPRKKLDYVIFNEVCKEAAKREREKNMSYYRTSLMTLFLRRYFRDHAKIDNRTKEILKAIDEKGWLNSVPSSDKNTCIQLTFLGLGRDELGQPIGRRYLGGPLTRMELVQLTRAQRDMNNEIEEIRKNYDILPPGVEAAYFTHDLFHSWTSSQPMKLYYTNHPSEEDLLAEKKIEEEYQKRHHSK